MSPNGLAVSDMTSVTILNDGIANLVTVSVVDRLEAVDIKHQHGSVDLSDNRVSKRSKKAVRFKRPVMLS